MPHQESLRQPDNLNTITPFRGPQTTELHPNHELVLLGAVTPESSPEQVREMQQIYLQAEECFPVTGRRIRPKVALIDEEKKTTYFRIAHDYLLEEGVNPEELEELFDEYGYWEYKDHSRGSIYELSPNEVHSVLRSFLRPVNRIIDRGLDGISPDGYNKHGEQHAETTTRQGIVLADYLGQPDSVKTNIIISLQGHDLGCAVTRKGHPFASLPMLRQIMPTIQDDPESYQAISRAILFHDSDTLRGLTAQWGNVSGEERLEKLEDFMGPVGLPVLIADKVDIGIGRVSDKIWVDNIIKDPHAVVNLLGKHLRLEPDNDVLKWIVEYNPDFTPAQMEKFKHFAHGWQRRRRRGDVNLSYDDWRKMFIGIYTERFITLAEASMAYLPFINKVELQMKDAESGEIKKTEALNRYTLDHDEDELRNKQHQLIKEGVLEYQ